MKKYFNLKLFDGETAETNAPDLGNQESSDKPTVVYGSVKEEPKQATEEKDPVAQDQKETPQEPTPEQLKAEYMQFKAKYKDFFTEDTQNIINKRFKETKLLETELNSFKPIMEILMEEYGVNDVNELSKTIKERSIEALAERNGMTVKQMEEVLNLRQENRDLRKKQHDEYAERQMNDQVKGWYDQADKLKELYPDFDLRTVAQNEEFLDLLKHNVTVKAAYEVCFMEDIKKKIAEETAKKVEENITANIQAKKARPPENGANSTPGVIVKNDVSKLTKEDRAEIMKRVAQGEKISFD